MIVPQNAAYLGIESFPIGSDRPAGRLLAPGRPARMIARLRAHSLERALIAGTDPACSRPLAARAAQLTSRRNRVQVAAGLERLLEAAEGPQRRWWAVSRRNSLVANAAAIGELAELLRADTPLYVRGIALLNQLLTDGTGAAYLGTSESLARELDDARAAMGG
jgi:hypothetical protein